MAKQGAEGTIMQLQQTVARLQQALKISNQAIQEVTAQRDQTNAERVSALTALICLLLEHHDGTAQISIALQQQLCEKEYRLGQFPSARSGFMRLIAQDALGTPITADTGEDLKAQIVAATPEAAAPEAPPTRCGECWLAFGEHRPGCPNAAQTSLALVND